MIGDFINLSTFNFILCHILFKNERLITIFVILLYSICIFNFNPNTVRRDSNSPSNSWKHMLCVSLSQYLDFYFPWKLRLNYENTWSEDHGIHMVKGKKKKVCSCTCMMDKDNIDFFNKVFKLICNFINWLFFQSIRLQ